MTLESKVKVTYTKICLTARKANSSFIFWPRVFIFGTMIVYYVCKFSENAYGIGALGVKVKFVLQLVTPFSYFNGVCSHFAQPLPTVCR